MLCQDTMSSVDQRNSVDLAFIDFSKAFDKVPHCHLITLAPLGGGGAKGPPCVFSPIAPEVLGISLWKLPYLSGQQFHTLY